MRIKVIKRSNEHLIFMDMHHIISDGMSRGILLRELSELYNGESKKTLRVQYKDYCGWMAKRDISNQKEYWIKEFNDDIPVLDMPLDKTRPKLQSFKGNMIHGKISEELSNLIKETVEKTGTTEYMVFLTSFMVLLSKYSRQDDIIVGTPVSGRTHRDTEHMLGMFVNTLVMRGQPVGEKTYIEFLQEMKEKCLKAYENQEYPFEELVESVEVRRDISRNPLFDVMLAMQNNEKNELKLNEVHLEELEGESEASKFDITVSLSSEGKGYSIQWQYCSDLYNEESMYIMLKHYIQITENLLRNPKNMLKEVEMITELEKIQILEEFNNTYAEYSREKTIVNLFEDQVAKTPDNVAVVFGDEKLTYAELNEKVNQLARKLRNMGIKQDDFVVLMAERSIEMIVAIYAILKSGGAYVPIDPIYPKERIKYMLEDSKPKLVLVYKAEVETKLPVIDLADKKIWSGVTTNLELVNTPKDLAYCIYTSGTTGYPKGVEIEHYGVSNLVNYFEQSFNISQNDRVLLFANIVFDGSVWEMSMALFNGATLYIPNEETIQDVNLMSNFVKKNNITISYFPPSYYEQGAIELSNCVITAGSVTNHNVVRKAIRTSNYVNSYGPTEATICVTHWNCKNGDIIPEHIPIGKPICNKRIYIITNNKLCGIGVPGELCIAGEGLARGYLNRPELTAEKFVRTPYAEGKIYKSGDLARWLPDGNIEYLGRIDEQVKIRGFRIEPGEIENVLKGIEKIKDATVIAKEDKFGDKAIYAYIVSDEKISISDMREKLRKVLPEYMMPAYMIQIDCIPVTRNGKLDIRALPEIETMIESGYVAPRNEMEETLCKIFSNILGIEIVGVKDSFFELGGHSLRATRLVNQVEAKIGYRLVLKDVFINPTVEKLAEYISKKENKEYSSITKAEEKEYYPMSSTQKRIYLICQMDSEGITYNMPQIFKLTGDVDSEAIRTALQEMINRHEILRTDFLMISGEPVQKIRETVEADFEYVEDKETCDKDLIREFVRTFNLGKAPVIRAKLIKREGCHLLMIDMHHIVGDGMSMGTFVKEFTALYNGETLESLAHQYKDYSEWMRTRDISAQREYWINEFSDEIPILDMPTDKTRPQLQSFNGKTMQIKLTEELSKKVKAFTEKTGTTEYMIFLTSFMVLLSKYSMQEDIVVGSPVSGRTHKDTESMLGMFINTLAMRGQPEAEKTYIEFLQEMKEKCLKAYENQEYPFEELVEAVETRRDISRNPLFDVMLVMQNNELSELNLKGIELEQLDRESNMAKFDISVSIVPEVNNYIVGWQFCTDLYNEESMEMMLNHYVQIINNLLSNPEVKLKKVEAVTLEEKNKIMKEFNDTAWEYPRDKTVVELFEEQVEKTPNNIAVVFEEHNLTYVELNEKANQLARKLRKLGVKPDDFVAIMAERSVEMIVGICGIIKSGAAYVPIDPTFPKERIQYTLEDCKPKAVLVYRADLEEDIPVIDLADSKVWKGESTNLIKVNKPEDLAYCIYTSGTTGNPKGVMIEHRGVLNFKENCIYDFKVTDKDGILLFANITFDASLAEIIMALLIGGTLFVPNSLYINDVDYIERYIKKNKMTILAFPPQFAIQMKYSDANFYLTAGSEANRDVVSKVVQHSDFVNSYGPTETTVCATYWRCKKGEEVPERIPIGKPHLNTKIYIINNDCFCGIGMPGELCIVREGLARGYLNRPELTAEKFIDNPYDGGKMYKSGDIARWLPDGNIEYLGRIDEQVKIRGFRIELGEIENAIRKIEAVIDVAVIAKTDSSGDKAIHAYIVSDQQLSMSEIRNSLSNILPEYMIPAYMMQLEKIPVTRNGKLDKKALPEIHAKSEREYVAPRNETEKIICDIFSSILVVDRVGVEDSFFELGGHSLRATRVINSIEAETGVRLSLKEIFISPTAEALAKMVMSSKLEEYIPIPNAEKREYYPMSSTQKRTYFTCQMDSKGVVYNMPKVLRLKGDVQPDAIRSALQEIINRHEILRTDFLMIDGEPIQKVREEVEADFRYVKDNETSETELVNDFIRPFDLSKAPMLRIKLVEREDCHLLMMDMHHIVGDGMSAGIFITEFTALYNGEMLELPIHQYKDYSEWMKTRDISVQKEYWVNEFSDEIPILNMPTDKIRPQMQKFNGKMIHLELVEELSRKIKETAEQTGTTEYMIFLTSFMVLLSKYSMQEDIVVGSPISGRIHKDTENMLGMFVNTLAMRGQPVGEKTYMEFLQEMKVKCLKAYENQEYPFEELVEAVGVTRDISRNPLFDVMLVMQNNERSELKLNRAQMEDVKIHRDISKFDINVRVGSDEDVYAIGWEYCSDLYHEQSMEIMVKQYVQTIENLLNNPEKELKEIEVITKEEKKKILKEFNNTYTEYLREKTVVNLFEEQVAKTPDNVAVVFENEQLTYAELNAKANQLARQLRKLGVKPDDFVAIIAERSIELIISIYGVLKSGGAYVPIDTTYPKDRVQHMLADCRAKAVLVYKAEVETDIPIINLDDGAVWKGEVTNLKAVNKPRDLIYAIYTSGTTGMSKGAMIEHRSVINSLTHMNNIFNVDQSYTTPLFTNHCFDFTVPYIFVSLLWGGQISIYTEIDKAIDEGAVGTKFSFFKITPSQFSGIGDDKKMNAACVVFGGEPLKKSDLLKVRRIFGENVPIFNEYGPTETTIFVTAFNAKDINIDSIPIGKPISNAQIYIQNKNNLCGIGIPGEICITGDGVGRGYVNRSELTAEKFIDNPYGKGKMYRSGDIGRWLPDGNIECLGRVDDQVKVRGFRIELEEIANVIRRLKHVKDTAVIVRTDAYGDKAIYAYIVSDQELSMSEIRNDISGVLPSYMIPTYMMQLEKIPVTGNGKLDKRALPEIVAKSQIVYVPPKTEEEKVVAAIIADIVKIERIGINDNIYELGVDSIKVMIMAYKLRQVGYKVNIGDIMKSPYVYSIANTISKVV